MKKSKQFVRVEARQAMIDGVRAGVRENTAQLFKVMSNESTLESGATIKMRIPRQSG